MCKVLGIPRSSFYYKQTEKVVDTKLENAVCEEFNRSRKNYGTRKLKVVLSRRGFVVSRRRIGKIMKKYRLVSNYTILQSKKNKTNVNNDEIANVVDREFDNRKKHEVVVSDLTYIKIAGKWHYTYFHFNRPQLAAGE